MVVSKFDRYLFCQDYQWNFDAKVQFAANTNFFGRLDFAGISLFGSDLFFQRSRSPPPTFRMEKRLFIASDNLQLGDSFAADPFLRQTIPLRAAKLVALITRASCCGDCFS